MFMLLHNRKHAVTQLVKALSYKSEGRGFHSDGDLILPAAQGPWAAMAAGG